MTKTDIEALVNAALSHGNPKYTTPSGAILEVLQEYAMKHDLQGLSEAAALYVQLCGGNRTFIAAQVPGILVNKYLNTLSGFDYDKFVKWSVTTSGWAKGIKDGVFDPERFIAEVAIIVNKVSST